MRTILGFVFATIVLVQAGIDWNHVIPNHIEPYRSKYTFKRKGFETLGGEECFPHSKPYQVGIFGPVANGTKFCGGSLISSRTVLTAAHCLHELVGPALVVLGAHSLRKDEQTQVRVESLKTIIHPEWSPNSFEYDVGLIILAKEVTLDDHIQVIKLPEVGNEPDYIGKTSILIGWGKDKYNRTTIFPVLREVELPIMANRRCNVWYAGLINSSNICASGKNGKSSCNGDSGGPLIVNGVQVGVASFGIMFGCEVGWPSVYSRVTSFRIWINKNAI